MVFVPQHCFLLQPTDCSCEGELWAHKTEAKEAAGTLTPLEIEEYNEPGPFSIVSYLESLLELSFYGEEIVVAATSMMSSNRPEYVTQTSCVMLMLSSLELGNCTIYLQVCFRAATVHLEL